jgi:AcrR family transcriptional regulator
MPTRPTPKQFDPPWRNEPAVKRLKEAAELLFDRYGAAATAGMIAALAHSNERTLCQHYGSVEKMRLAYIERNVKLAYEVWEAAERKHPGDAESQLREWIWETGHSADEWGSADRHLMRIGEQLHTAFGEKSLHAKIIDAWRKADHRQIAELCRKAAFKEPDVLADKLMMLVDGARSNRGFVMYGRLWETLSAAADDLMVVHGAKRKLPLELED